MPPFKLIVNIFFPPKLCFIRGVIIKRGILYIYIYIHTCAYR